MSKHNLEPKALFGFFDEICSIPHPSKHEEQISAYLQEFGKKLGYETIADEAGNVLIKKPATSGKENLKTVILQSHMDMVCEKNSNVEFDFENDPIETYIDGDWVKAKGTTLGADNGLGLAMAIGVFHSAWSIGLATAGIIAGIAAITASIASVKKQAENTIQFYANGASDIDGGTMFVAGEMGKTEAVYTG